MKSWIYKGSQGIGDIYGDYPVDDHRRHDYHGNPIDQPCVVFYRHTVTGCAQLLGQDDANGGTPIQHTNADVLATMDEEIICSWNGTPSPISFIILPVSSDTQEMIIAGYNHNQEVI